MTNELEEPRHSGAARVDPARVARRWALVAVGASALLALAVSATWLLDRWALLTLGSGYVPMAPVTALLVLLLGGSVVVSGGDGRGSRRAASALLAAIAGALALGVLAGATLGIPLRLEAWLSSTDEQVGGITVGRTSGYTAAIALVLTTGLLWRALSRGRRGPEVGAAVLVILSCFLILQGYLFGGPLFYGTGTIPVAATTAACFLLLGIGFLFTGGTDLWPARVLLPGGVTSEPVSPWAFRMLTATLAMLVVISAALWVSGEGRRAEALTRETLAAIADLKADEIAAWYSGHRSLARAVQALPALLATPASGGASDARLRAWMETLRQDNGYAAVAWVDTDGEIRTVVPEGHALDEALVRDQLADARATPEPRFEDLHRDGEELAFKLWVPVAATDAAQPPAGWLLLEIDARRRFISMVNDLPLPTSTTEILLWRSEGDSAVVLNDTRVGGNPALTLRLPLGAEGSMPGLQPAAGEDGLRSGADYRGMPVTSVSRPVPGTPWTLLAKMDRDEIRAPIVRAAVTATGISLLLLLGTVTAVYALWSRRELALVHDREAALEEHQAALTLFRQAIDGSTDAFYVADAETGLFVDFNEGAARQLGYTRDELLAMGPPDIAPHLQDPETWGEVLEAARRGGASVRKSLHVRKDGTELPVEVSFSLVETGSRTLILAISRDISERDAAERESEALRQQLEQSQKMESVGRLAGGVAHDFNNLLTVVNATADLVLAELEPDAAIRAELEEIRGAGERAARLTRQLLAFSRRQVLHPRRVQVNDVVREFLDMIRRVIGEQIVLEAALADDLPLIESDAGQLEQVLMNLCVNARDAMPSGGSLTIATRRIMLSESDAARHVAMAPGEHVLLSVADTGDGMDEVTRARVFEPFFTTKDRSKGTGLGLSTVYGIVKQSGGTIWVYSEVGLGTTFKIYFPAARTRPLDPVDPSPGPTGSETILLVEDKEPIRRLVRRILDRAGYSVVEAATAAEALEVLQRPDAQVDMLLTDLVMPGMSGTQLAARVAARYPEVRILLATGYSAEALASRLPQDRHWSIIGKPYAVEELLHTVRGTLDR